MSRRTLRFSVLAALCLSFWVAVSAEEIAFSPKRPEKPLRFCRAYAAWENFVRQDSSYVEITSFPFVSLDLRYATFENVTGHDLYCGAKRAYLKRAAAEKFRKAIRLLQAERPGFRFVVLDASRPVYAQARLRETVVGTPFADYVSNPRRGSVHNFGFALDLTLADSTGTILDMGTDFDSFENRAGKRGEADALEMGTLTAVQVENRELLRRIMRDAGFLPLDSEWWHFNAIASKKIRATGELPPF